MPVTGPLIITWAIDPRERYYERNSIEGLAKERFTPFDEATIQNFRQQVKIALDRIERLVNVDFVEVAFQPDEPTNARAMIDFRLGSLVSERWTRSSAEFPSPFGWVEINQRMLTMPIILHEIGHILGLAHPFERKGDFPHRVFDPTTGLWSRTGFDSLMGYDNYPDGSGFTENDVKVLQFLYGAPGTDYDGLQSLLGLDTPPPEILDWL